LPAVAAVSCAAVALGFVGWVVARGDTRGHRGPFTAVFGVLPPLAFVLLELLEPLGESGELGWRELAGSTFLAGLVLLVPFALLGWLLATLLLRAGDRIRALVRARLFQSAPVAPRALSEHGRRPCLDRACFSWNGRAPPVALTASA